MKRSAEWSDDRESKKQLIERVHTPWRKIEQSELNLTDTCDVSPLGAIYFIDDTHANFPNMKRGAWYRDFVGRNPDRSACYNYVRWLQPGLSEESIRNMYSQIDLWTKDGVYYFFRKPSLVDIPRDAMLLASEFGAPVQMFKMRRAASEFKDLGKPDCTSPTLYLDESIYWQIKDLIKKCDGTFKQIVLDGPAALESPRYAYVESTMSRLSLLTDDLVVTSAGVADTLNFTGPKLHVKELVVGPDDFSIDDWFHLFEWRRTPLTVDRWVIQQPEPDEPGLHSLDDVVAFIRKVSNSPIYLGIGHSADLAFLEDPRFAGFIADPVFRSRIPPEKQNVIYRHFA